MGRVFVLEMSHQVGLTVFPSKCFVADETLETCQPPSSQPDRLALLWRILLGLTIRDLAVEALGDGDGFVVSFKPEKLLLKAEVFF